MRLCLLASMLALTACAQTYTIVPPSTFPKPAVQPVAMSAGLYADPGFKDYKHSEKLPTGSTWNVSLGPSSLAMFRTVLVGSFTRLQILDTEPASGKPLPVDLAFTPAIEEFQFATGTAAGAEFIEAWIKYKVGVHGVDGRELANWPIAAYGRHRSAAFGGTEIGLGLAIQEAMRDAGAALALKLRSVRKVPPRPPAMPAAPAAADAQNAPGVIVPAIPAPVAPPVAPPLKNPPPTPADKAGAKASKPQPKDAAKP